MFVQTGKFGRLSKIKTLNHRHIIFPSFSLDRQNEKCTPMQKTFYLQFQWMPFFISSLALLHYFPYLIFRIVNTDIISLKATLKGEIDTDSIVKNYFNYKINSIHKMRIRIMLNVIIKCMYVGVCCIGFWLCDKLMNQDFFNYGTNWVKWTKYNNSMSHDIKVRAHPKPGKQLELTFFSPNIQKVQFWA